jgi:Sec-independent protein secretion pathway component TatC
MIIESLMLYALYEVGIVISRVLARSDAHAPESDDDLDLTSL